MQNLEISHFINHLSYLSFLIPNNYLLLRLSFYRIKVQLLQTPTTPPPPRLEVINPYKPVVIDGSTV